MFLRAMVGVVRVESFAAQGFGKVGGIFISCRTEAGEATGGYESA